MRAVAICIFWFVSLCYGTLLSSTLLAAPRDPSSTSESAQYASSLLFPAVVAISAGGSHVCVVTVSGGVKCAGYNGNGRLGDGTTESRGYFADVTGLTAGVF